MFGYLDYERTDGIIVGKLGVMKNIYLGIFTGEIDWTTMEQLILTSNFEVALLFVFPCR